MRKISSVFVTLVLVLTMCLLPVGVSADTAAPTLKASYDFTNYTDATVTIGGVLYNVVYTADQLMDLTMAAGQNYILANDITIDFASNAIVNRAVSPFDDNDVGGKCLIVAGDESAFYGNGKKLTVSGLVFDVGYSSLFGAAAEDTAGGTDDGLKFSVYDLSLAGDCTFKKNSSGMILGYFAESKGLGNGGVTIENVHLDMAITAVEQLSGGFIGYVRAQRSGVDSIDVNITNCTASGTIAQQKAAKEADTGAFIGRFGYKASAKCVMTFTNCSSDTVITGAGGRLGSLIGYANSGVTFNAINCTCTGSISTTFENGVIGSFAAHLKGPSVFDHCVSTIAGETGIENVTPLVGTPDGSILYKECTWNGTAYDTTPTVCEHDYGTDAPVYDSVGSHAQTCKKCGEKLLTAHNYGDYIDDGNGKCYRTCADCGHNGIARNHAMEYTALQDGTHKSVCSNCNAEKIEAHVYSDGNICDNCGFENVTEALTTDSAATEEKTGCGSTVGLTFASMIMLLGVGYVCSKKGNKVN